MRVRFDGPGRFRIDGETVERGGEFRVSQERFNQINDGTLRFTVVDDERPSPRVTAQEDKDG